MAGLALPIAGMLISATPSLDTSVFNVTAVPPTLTSLATLTAPEALVLAVEPAGNVVLVFMPPTSCPVLRVPLAFAVNSIVFPPILLEALTDPSAAIVVVAPA